MTPDEQRWNEQIADNAKINELLADDGRNNGREILTSWVEDRIEKAKSEAFGTEPLEQPEYLKKFYEYQAYKNLYVYVTTIAPKKAEIAKKKLDELDAVQSATSEQF